MRPAQFNFAQPRSLAEAAGMARAGATFLSGGQALIQSLRLRSAQPSAIVDLKRVVELSRQIDISTDVIKIGALVTVSALLEAAVVPDTLPMLCEAANRLGDVQVRNRATVVGNICWADPRANLAVALLAYDATLHVHNGQSERILNVRDCFFGFRSVALLPGEIVTAIDVRLSDPILSSGYLEFSRQRNDLALVSVAIVRRQAAGYSIAAGGLGRTPLRLTKVESLLAAGTARPSIESLKAAVEQSSVESLGDPYGSLNYKIHIGAVLLSQILANTTNGISHAQNC
jgi:aerobic carbon-monoxide dehydrogenase medium subunit